jgi:hypothetical protein
VSNGEETGLANGDHSAGVDDEFVTVCPRKRGSIQSHLDCVGSIPCVDSPDSVSTEGTIDSDQIARSPETVALIFREPSLP